MNRPGTTQTHKAPPTSDQRSPSDPQAKIRLLAFPDLLDRMTSVERLRAYRCGAFSPHERTIWASRFPEEAPLLNGELEWIARSLADLD
jgi:hypothetical protein